MKRKLLYARLFSIVVLMLVGTMGSAQADVSGSWSVTEVEISTCEIFGINSYTVTLQQNGANLTIGTPMGTFSGTIIGNIIFATYSYGETVWTVLTASVWGNFLIGTTLWMSTDYGACLGMSMVFGNRW